MNFSPHSRSAKIADLARSAEDSGCSSRYLRVLTATISEREAMKLNLLSPRAWLMVVGCAALCSASVGCQTTVGGQTLPSPNYLRDDLSYFPPGPEFKL